MSVWLTRRHAQEYSGAHETLFHFAFLLSLTSFWTPTRATWCGALLQLDVYESVRSGEHPVGLIPQENSIHGIVVEAYDIFKEPAVGREVFVRGEVTIGIQHCLITRKGVALKDVKRILSHEQVRTNSDFFVCNMELSYQNSFYPWSGCAFRSISYRARPSHIGSLHDEPGIHLHSIGLPFPHVTSYILSFVGAWTVRSIHQEVFEGCRAREDILHGGSSGSPVG